jgi:hypothetical protein
MWTNCSTLRIGRVYPASRSPHKSSLPCLHRLDQAKLAGRAQPHPITYSRQVSRRPQSARWYGRPFRTAVQQHPILLNRAEGHSAPNKSLFRSIQLRTRRIRTCLRRQSFPCQN